MRGKQSAPPVMQHLLEIQSSRITYRYMDAAEAAKRLMDSKGLYG
jgi:hypothetical protein